MEAANYTAFSKLSQGFCAILNNEFAFKHQSFLLNITPGSIAIIMVKIRFSYFKIKTKSDV